MLLSEHRFKIKLNILIAMKTNKFYTIQLFLFINTR